jgi:hypothetical protein
VASAGVCVLWFAYLNWDGCWFYWNRARGLAGFALLWLWLLLLFGLKMKGRFVFVAFTLLVLFFSQVESSHVAAAESSAVATLREYRSALARVLRGQVAAPELPANPTEYCVTVPASESLSL